MKQEIVRVADLRQQAYDALKAKIIAGGFSPDARLQEIALAQEMGVSRTPVREALAMLVRDGLLAPATRGFTLPRFSPQEITEATEIRLLIEPYAIRRMIEDNAVGTMRDLGQRMRAILQESGPTETYPEAHRAAREAIYEHIRNALLVETMRRVEDRVHFMRITTLNDPDTREVSYTGMIRLATAIESSNGDEAFKQMRRQLTNALQAFMDLRTRPDAAEAL